MSETAETGAAVGFDPKAFAEAHGLNCANLSWYDNNGSGFYCVYAHADHLGQHGLVNENGATISEAVANTVKAIEADRKNADQKRLDRITRLKSELAKLEASPALAEAQ